MTDESKLQNWVLCCSISNLLDHRRAEQAGLRLQRLSPGLASHRRVAQGHIYAAPEVSSGGKRGRRTAEVTTWHPTPSPHCVEHQSEPRPRLRGMRMLQARVSRPLSHTTGGNIPGLAAREAMSGISPTLQRIPISWPYKSSSRDLSYRFTCTHAKSSWQL